MLVCAFWRWATCRQTRSGGDLNWALVGEARLPTASSHLVSATIRAGPVAQLAGGEHPAWVCWMPWWVNEPSGSIQIGYAVAAVAAVVPSVVSVL